MVFTYLHDAKTFAYLIAQERFLIVTHSFANLFAIKTIFY